MNDDFEMERAVPSAEKLESLSNLFDFALLPKEQRLYIMFILLRSLQMMGRSELLKMIAMIETDTMCKCECMGGDNIEPCDCKCPVCNSDRDEEWYKKAAQMLWEKMQHYQEEDCDCEECNEIKKRIAEADGDDEWAEVIQ